MGLFFAPVVSRFQTYGVPLEGVAADYSATVLAMPAMRDWIDKATAESHTLPEFDALP